MEQFVVILILLLMILISYIFEKNLYNPLFVFLMLFFVITILSSLQLYGMLPFSSKPYWIILIGCLGYCIGYVFLRLSRNRKIKLFGNQTMNNYTFNDKLIKCINILLLIFYATTAIRVFISMRNYDLDYSSIRTLYANGTKEEQVRLIFGSSFLQTLELLFFKPMLFSMLSITITRIFTKMKFDKQSLITLITLLLNVAVNFSRIVLVQIAFCTLITYFTFGNKFNKEEKIKIKKVFKKYIVPGIMIFLVLFIYISYARQSNRSNSLSFDEELYSYLSIPLPIMDKWINYIDNNHIQTYGALFVRGGISILDMLTNKLGFHFPGYTISTEIVNSTQEFLHIFPNHNYNAFTTMFYYFYVDWREIGVFLGSAIYGMLMSISYIKTKNEKNNLLYCAYFVMLLQGLLKSFVRWEFVQTSYILSFIYILFMIKKKATGK